MGSADAARDRLSDPQAEVSAHYLIRADGAVWQLVDEAQRAWHAGVGSWQGLDDINSRSIGIELDNRGTHPFAEPQMDALEGLLRGIMRRWSIPAEGVIGHSDMAPGRKTDPGPRFDWSRLARQGLARSAGNGTTRTLTDAAEALGYDTSGPPETLLSAMRLRYRPWGTGPLCAADLSAFPA